MPGIFVGKSRLLKREGTPRLFNYGDTLKTMVAPFLSVSVTARGVVKGSSPLSIHSNVA